MKKIILLFPFFMLACATYSQSDINWIQTGPKFEPNKKPIEMFSKKADIQKTFAFVGVGRVDHVNQSRDSMLGAISTIKKEAAKRGSDGVIVTQYINDQDPSSGLSITGHAFKYVENLTDKDKEAIEEFKILGPVN